MHSDITIGVMGSSGVLDNEVSGGDWSLSKIILLVLIYNSIKSYTDPEGSQNWRRS